MRDSYSAVAYDRRHLSYSFCAENAHMADDSEIPVLEPLAGGPAVDLIATAIAAIDIDNQLVRQAVLGQQLSFADERPMFEEATNLAERLLSLPTADLPEPHRSGAIRSNLQQIHQVLVSISQFQVAAPNAAAHHENLIKNLGNALHAFWDGALLPLAYLNSLAALESNQSVDLEDLKEDARQEIRAVTEELQQSSAQSRDAARKLLASLEESQSQAETAARAVETAAAEAGVSQYSGEFASEARGHAKNSWRWLIGLALVVALAGFTVWGLIELWPLGPDGTNVSLNDARAIQIVLIKTLIVGFLVFAGLTCIRMFRAERHLAVVNRHRDLALRTFETFVGGTHADDVKDAVLLEATRAIFSHADTGMLGGSQRQSDSSSIMEIVRRASGPSSD